MEGTGQLRSEAVKVCAYQVSSFLRITRIAHFLDSLPMVSSSRTETGPLDNLKRKPGVQLSFQNTPPKYLYSPQTDTSTLCAVKFTFSDPADGSGKPDYDTGLHFHVDKTETLRVENGAIGVQLGDEELTVTPDAGEVLIPRWTIHRWWLLPDAQGDTVVWERTIPGSREKEAFFRMLISYLGDLKQREPPAFFQLYAIFASWDNFPVLGTWLGGWVGRWSVVAYTKFMGCLGRLLGYQSAYPEYLPSDIFAKAR